MSLYYDAASILSTRSSQKGSLKSLIYAKPTPTSSIKSKPSHLYALISETSKYDTLLKEVIDNAGILAHEPKLTPLLALLLIHDHLFAKSGIAARTSHPLRQAVERHKARLHSEFTKARLKRRVPDVEALKIAVLKEKGIAGRAHPRWVRVNTLKVALQDLIQQRFAEYRLVDTVEEIVMAGKNEKVIHQDIHIPGLLAFPPEVDLTKHQAYLNGEIIFQDKASCFPAHLLLGDQMENGVVGNVMDACAAPGNKTTHAAALTHGTNKTVYACERDATRSKTLQMMVQKAGAGQMVKVLPRQDFLALDVHDSRFENVTHLLLDPSCSGSGILGREDIPELALPSDMRKKGTPQESSGISKKRKRGEEQKNKQNGAVEDATANEDAADDTEAEEIPIEATKARLEKLSNLQSRIVEHAFTFPSAVRVTYSTCSIHEEENEVVVERVLNSVNGKSRGWRVLRREEQVDGLRTWKHRGVSGRHGLTEEQREACIRCTPEDGEGTMGFFVCGFVRDAVAATGDEKVASNGVHAIQDDAEDDWDGFSDS